MATRSHTLDGAFPGLEGHHTGAKHNIDSVLAMAARKKRRQLFAGDTRQQPRLALEDHHRGAQGAR